ncbi:MULTISPECIES: dimethylamine monooxygenase subunit DmmA family protein [unclassified Rhodococcus (in: high G+C Gram-positive bacteria)]|uniref:dimethylamine monooxygenase subunit DmmA family protein n=1 Tax=unclassified Rhodococcus (in: high G+C Gram-positive bacteria) TaxID=192944 RepID=UPI002079067A|nr:MULTISPECIES: dimethylamine monooxygenase subunit DmmA family protein [unclassified Rhodococcus (in: high G+C Gram-positive bacteria)]
MRSTSVPRWRSDYQAVDDLAAGTRVTRYALVSDSSVSAQALRELTELVAPVPTLTSTVENVEGSGLDDLLCEARIGWRFVVAGSERTVAAVRSRLISGGALPAEIAAVIGAPDTPVRDVFCGHCHTTSPNVPVAVGGTTPCAGCSEELTVYYHFSRRHSAYLGYRADAEELP